jgi:hypothetical protein
MSTNVESFLSLVGSAVVASTDLIPVIWKQGIGGQRNRVMTVDEFRRGLLPFIHLSAVNTLSLASGADALISWGSLEIGNSNMWNAASATLVVIPRTGLYQFTFQYQWPLNSTGLRDSHVKRNGNFGDVTINATAISGDNTRQVLSGVINCTAGDLCEVDVFHTAGTTLISANARRFTVNFIGR